MKGIFSSYMETISELKLKLCLFIFHEELCEDIYGVSLVFGGQLLFGGFREHVFEFPQ